MSPSPAGAAGARAPWQATVLTVFPGMSPGLLEHSLAGRAFEAGVWSFEAVDIRAHAGDKYALVDGLAFGGKGKLRMHLIDAIEQERVEETEASCPTPDFRPGGTLRAGARATESSYERIQAREGVLRSPPLLSRMYFVPASKKLGICRTDYGYGCMKTRAL